MDNLQAVQKSIRGHLFSFIFFENLLLITSFALADSLTHLPALLIAGVSLLVSLALSVFLTVTLSQYVTEPLAALQQTILHISPSEQQAVGVPDLAKLRLGRELLTTLTGQLYQIANVAQKVQQTALAENNDLHHNFIASNLPLPLFVLDNTETIQYANNAAAAYLGLAADDMLGKNVYMVLDMAFPSEDTFDHWLKTSKQSSATAANSWERVRLTVRDNHPTRLFDLSAYYNRDNAEQHETLLLLFDHTKQYSQDEQAVSFIALSVHELRTPLTLLRGYIEVFEEELGDKIAPDLLDFMHKMNATAQQLTAFVNNILNVARVDDDQLELKLQEANWATIITSAVENISLRAQVRGIAIEYKVAAGLPTVGVDRLSIYEVISNLVDNAIKYSGASKRIVIDAHLSPDGMVETTVQDFGVGISSNIMPNLFTKFYRDHRNRAQIGGTGLGLYLSKAIVTAHGGQFWVRSKEAAGSTFGFTIQPYARLAEEVKNSVNKEIVHGAHGWIKNHSLYRR